MPILTRRRSLVPRCPGHRLACWLGLMIAVQTATGAEPSVRELFDGKSLKNWNVTDFGGQGEVTVDEGKLILGQGEPITGVNWTGPALPKVNYEISLEAQRIQGNDFFLCLTFPVQESCCSLVLGGWGGSVTGFSSINGFDASENETTDYISFEREKWYPVRVRVTETHLSAWLGEQRIAHVETTDQKVSVRLEMELCKPLGLASYRTTGGVRDIKLRELSADQLKEKTSP